MRSPSVRSHDVVISLLAVFADGVAVLLIVGSDRLGAGIAARREDPQRLGRNPGRS